jgi:very-short-patch-repair endonuclease
MAHSLPRLRGRVGEGAGPMNFKRDAVLQQRARTLRRQSTDAERHLWHQLRRRRIGGYRFRRQVPIAGFIADFACLEARLVVELDGGQHVKRKSYDGERDRKLAAEGFRVLRFWDNEAFVNTQAVLDTILHALESTAPHPNLPPQAGEGV